MVLFNVLNPAVASIWPWHCWLWFCKPKRLQFSSFFNSHFSHPPTEIRIRTNGVFGPIRCPDSNRGVHLAVALLVLLPHTKTSPIFAIFQLHFSHPPTTIRIRTNGVFGPIQCHDSNCGVRLAVALLVLLPHAKTSPIIAIL